MFHMIRQNAAGSVHVLGRMLDVLAGVAGRVERQTDRAAELARHADLVIAAARRDVNGPPRPRDLEERYQRFQGIASAREAARILATNRDHFVGIASKSLSRNCRWDRSGQRENSRRSGVS